MGPTEHSNAQRTLLVPSDHEPQLGASKVDYVGLVMFGTCQDVCLSVFFSSLFLIPRRYKDSGSCLLLLSFRLRAAPQPADDARSLEERFTLHPPSTPRALSFSPVALIRQTSLSVCSSHIIITLYVLYPSKTC